MKRFATELSPDEARRVVSTMDDIAPRVLPGDWSLIDNHLNARWYRSRDGLAVCTEVEFQDDELWLHVSLSRAKSDRMPNYHDVKRVKDLFVGDSRKAIQVLPSKDEHYNFHPHCLHMWSPLDRDPLPDFRAAGGQL